MDFVSLLRFVDNRQHTVKEAARKTGERRRARKRKTSGGVRRCRVVLSRQMKAEEILEHSSIHEMQIKSRHTRQKKGGKKQR